MPFLHLKNLSDVDCHLSCDITCICVKISLSYNVAISLVCMKSLILSSIIWMIKGTKSNNLSFE